MGAELPADWLAMGIHMNHPSDDPMMCEKLMMLPSQRIQTKNLSRVVLDGEKGSGESWMELASDSLFRSSFLAYQKVNSYWVLSLSLSHDEARGVFMLSGVPACVVVEGKSASVLLAVILSKMLGVILPHYPSPSAPP